MTVLSIVEGVCYFILELRASCNESLACFIVLRVFIEVLDEALSEVFCLFFPFSRILVGILRVEDVGVNTFKFRRYFEVEERNLLRRSFLDSAAMDSIDDTAGIFDGDTLASS